MIFCFRLVQFQKKLLQHSFLNNRCRISFLKDNVDLYFLPFYLDPRNISVLKKTEYVTLPARKLSPEIQYFTNFIDKHSNYKVLSSIEDLVKENSHSTNKLVNILRNITINQEPLYSNINWDSIGDSTEYENEKFTFDDILEICYLLSKFQTAQPSEVKDLRSLLAKKMNKIELLEHDIQKHIIILYLITKCNPTLYHIGFKPAAYATRKLHTLSNSELVLLLYYFMHKRSLPHYKEHKYKIFKTFETRIPEFNLDELSVFACALFRCQIRPTKGISILVSQRLESDIEKLCDVQTSVLAKFLRLSHNFLIRKYLRTTYEKFSPMMNKFPVMTNIHLASAGVTMNGVNREFTLKVIERVTREINSVRLKDIERLLLTSLYANIELSLDSDFIRSILEKLAVIKDEIVAYPTSFLYTLSYLCTHGIYPFDFLSFALSKEFQEILKEKKFKLKKLYNLAYIDSCLEIDRPDYTGNRLDSKLKKKILITRRFSIPDFQYTSLISINNEILNILTEIYGDKSCILSHPLFIYDTKHIILCLNKNGEPQTIGEEYKNQSESMRVPKDGNIWICFIVFRLAACTEDLITPSLVLQAKVKHFKSCGYSPILVRNSLWYKFSSEEKKSFLLENIKKNL